MKRCLVIAAVALVLSGTGLAQSRAGYPEISFVGPSSGRPTLTKDQLVTLVIEGPFVSHEKAPIAPDIIVGYVNDALKSKGVSAVGVHIREGVKYGDVVRVLDTLSQTDARSIGVSMVELAAGRDL